ncbi:MAG: tetraacyldisaccharide 4'-kinase, partial [Bacteroidia bacterium]|nr:tetraacyldisaccharide 4'-kinase [Bacteroidia bacterium]
PDHHQYKISELKKLNRQFENITTKNKIIITTEKDSMRLSKSLITETIHHLPLFYIPMETTFLFGEGELFNKQVFAHIKP